MRRFLAELLGFESGPAKVRAKAGKARTNQFRPTLECLEDRALMSAVALLDFDGEFLTAGAMAEAGWSTDVNGNPLGNTTVPSFRGMFGGKAPLWMDFNGDRVVNDVDAGLAVSRIVAKVRQDFAPYDIIVELGDQDNRNGPFGNGRTGDALVIISGGTDFLSNQNKPGWSKIDPGNANDDIAWVMGRTILNGYTKTKGVGIGNRFVNAVAREISRQMGHGFGLAAVAADSGNDASRHHLMNVPAGSRKDARDFTHDFLFPDLDFATNAGVQNAHEILTEVLGASPKSWMAVLKPGTLTVKGSDSADSIWLASAGPNTWSVDLNGLLTFVDRSNAAGVTAFNPFNVSLSRVEMSGRGGNDVLVTAGNFDFYVKIYGGDGHDFIRGGAGRDHLYGNDGNDTIEGGADNDLIYGGAGDDVLRGQGGNDMLAGGSDNDHLDGGHDSCQDQLFGESGIDTFVQYVQFSFFFEDVLKDKESQDIVNAVSV